MKVEFVPVEIPEKGWRAIRVKVTNDGPDMGTQGANDTPGVD